MSPSTPVLSPAGAPSPVSPASVTIVINGKVRLPANLTDLDSFRRWARSDARPEKSRFSWINGGIWVETEMEQMYTHNLVKTEVARVLSALVRQTNKGNYLSDGMQISNAGAALSTIPDGLFVPYDALLLGRVIGVPNVRNVGAVELEGSPEMVLEVVSDSSVDKDFVALPPAYYLAHVDEFWRIDVRNALRFEIFRWTATGYEPTQLPDGWWHSSVFDRDFLLTQDLDPVNQPHYTLQIRP